MKKFLSFVGLALAVLVLLPSCSDDDKKYLTLPIFEIGLSSADVYVGDNVHISLVNKNNPINLRYNSYIWSCDPEVNNLLPTTSNGNNSFVPQVAGNHQLTVKIDITNYADGRAADDGKKFVSGETENSYKVSTLKTTMFVTRTIKVKNK